MNICVLGLWHLGTVTAACLASVGHRVVGLDFQLETVNRLQTGQPPVFEPGLEELIKRGLSDGRLRFTASMDEALNASTADAAPQIVWVCFDTPVDQDDQADVEFVIDRIERVFPHLRHQSIVLISSQLPVGTTRKLEQAYRKQQPDKTVTFAYSPENLRLGSGISAFTSPDRLVVGIRNTLDQDRIAALLYPLTRRIEWMSLESAEMTKHALNAFLATSVAFINELSVICEHVGADAKEVERGLKTESRIGPKAYLSPGAAFAGGTLARDIAFLTRIGAEHHLPTHLLSAVRRSNDAHKNWASRKLEDLLAPLQGRRVAVLGLTYKAGTDTLRRSCALELCEWLTAKGVHVQAHDPAVKSLPLDLRGKFSLVPTPKKALADADALVVATAWPDYLSLDAETVVSTMRSSTVLDPARFLAGTLAGDPRIRYVSVGHSPGL